MTAGLPIASARGAQRRRGAAALPMLPAAVALLVTFLALILTVVPSEAGSYSSRGGFRRLAVSGDEAAAGVALPDLFIVAGSDSVAVEGARLERGRDYTIDVETGLLTVTAAVEPQAAVEITYLYVPIELERIHTRAVMESLATLPKGFAPEARLVESAGGREHRPGPGRELSIGGAKTFGITMGSNRDPSLEQSLRMNVNGRLTRDLSVSAYLSDQNTPLVPEGDTEELRALDEVLIELTGKSGSATLGDYTLELDGGPLARFRREASGASARAKIGPVDVALAGARSAGRFRSITFRGVDGKQGAYLLTDDSGATGVSVVAGSERVWVDGERMTRGSDNDYVIDYTGGAIEFTEHRPILNENEITVDYEFTAEDYRRDTYAARVALYGRRPPPPGSSPVASTTPTRGGSVAGSGIRSGSGIGLSFFRDADDREAATGAGLSEREIAVLAAAGDDVELAHDEGVDSVGAGNGDYEYVSEGVFEYAGADSGEYDLHFERADGGDYTYDYVHGYYEYVGAGSGDYRLGRALPMPSEHTLVATDGRVALGKGGFVEASAALSDHDLNTFSNKDDGDNLGNAEVLSAVTPELSIGGEHGPKLGFSVDARRVGGTFKGVGRFRELGYEERWELGGLALPTGESMAEGTSSLGLPGGGDVKVSHAFLRRGDALSSARTEFEVSGRQTEGGRLWGSGRFVRSEWTGPADGRRRHRDYYKGGYEQKTGPVAPGVSYVHDERTENDAGERYDEYGGSLASAGTGALTFGASYARRYTDRKGGALGTAWIRASTTVTQEYRLGLTKWKALRVEGNVVRRSVEFEERFSDPASRYDLASVIVDHSSFDGRLTGELRYSVTSTEIEEKERFVTEEDGVEITRIVRTGRYLPVTDLTAGTRWNYRPGRGSRSRRSLPEPSTLGRLLSGLTLTSDVKIREMTTTNERLRLYLLDTTVLQGEDTVRGEITTRSVARYLSGGSGFSLRVAADTRDALDRSYSNDATSTLERSGTVDAKLTRPGGVTYRVEVDAGRRERDSQDRDDYAIDERSLLGEAGFRRLGDFEARLTASVAGQNDAVSGIDVVVTKVTPGLTYRLAGKGAFTASVTRVEVMSSGGALAGVPQLAEGRREGLSAEWRLNGDYRFNQYLTGSLSYSGEARAGADPLHTLDLRVNAFF
jgi:hypothetical protein